MSATDEKTPEQAALERIYRQATYLLTGSHDLEPWRREMIYTAAETARSCLDYMPPYYLRSITRTVTAAVVFALNGERPTDTAGPWQ